MSLAWSKKFVNGNSKAHVEQVGYSKHKMYDMACRIVAYRNAMSDKFL